MWFFVVLLSGQVFTSSLVLTDTSANSKTVCIGLMNAAYNDMHASYDRNLYGIATNDGAIHRRHEWEFKCVK